MRIDDFGVRYVSARTWCWRAEDGSWRKVPKWSARLYLKVKCGLGERRTGDYACNIDTAMDHAAASFRIDLAGHYDFDEKIRSAVDRFLEYFPTDLYGKIKAGEYQLPDGRLILLTNDVNLGLTA
jgi:hypothetical protein